MATATEPTIEQRLSAAEAAIVEIRRQLPSPATGLGWLERMIGSQADEPAFDEVIAHGRSLRTGEHPNIDDQS